MIGGRSDDESVTPGAYEPPGSSQLADSRRLPAPDYACGMFTNLIIAASSADPPGDDWQTVAYVLLGIALVVVAIATVMVTPRAEHHDH